MQPPTGKPKDAGAARVQASQTARSSPRTSIVEAFEGPIARRRVSVFYFLGLLVVAAGMILLPLTYIALIACVTYAIFYHAVEHIVILTPAELHGIYSYLAKVFLYVAPLIAGPILVLFMIKPLFAKPAEQDQPLTLDPS